MPEFDVRNIQDEDTVEITDLDPLNDDSNASLSFVLLKFIRTIPFFTHTRARSTALALLACVFVLLFLVQPEMPSLPTRVSSTFALDTTYAIYSLPSLSIPRISSAKEVTWIRISNGKVIVRKARAGTIVWHHCKVQHWFTPPKYTHPTVVFCI
jgi:hypothetical protein